MNSRGNLDSCVKNSPVARVREPRAEDTVPKRCSAKVADHPNVVVVVITAQSSVVMAVVCGDRK